MDELLKGIQSAFNASTTLSGLFPNGCYSVRAPNDEPLPVCVVLPALSKVDKTTGGDVISYYAVRFTVYATDGDFVAQALDALNAAYDEQPLSLGGGSECLRVCRSQGNSDIDVDDDNVTQGQITFEVWIQSNL